MSIVRSQTTFSDPDEAARLVSSVYFPHDLRVLGQDRDFGLRIQSAEIGPVTVGILSYGVEVSVDCSYPRSYTMNIPLSGRIESCMKVARLGPPADGALFFPGPTRQRHLVDGRLCWHGTESRP